MLIVEALNILERHFLTGLRSLGLCQPAAIIIHPDCRGTLHTTGA